MSIADRFETICTAITASYLNIPVAHIQGGEVSGSIDESAIVIENIEAMLVFNKEHPRPAHAVRADKAVKSP